VGYRGVFQVFEAGIKLHPYNINKRKWYDGDDVYDNDRFNASADLQKDK
jgi:hypothetical protein